MGKVCKTYRKTVSGRSKKAKKRVVIAQFSKIEALLKALYVRLEKKGGAVFFCPPVFSARQKAKSAPLFTQSGN